MENLDLNAKKAELLSDEELLKVTGGNGINPEVMNNAKKAMCNSAKNEADCNQWDFCTWKETQQYHFCAYKG